MQPSKGLAWALSMLGLDVFEWIVLAHIVFLDMPEAHLKHGGLLIPYFWLVSVSFVMQLVGVFLVDKRWYRLGGWLQIISSSVHVFKGEGLIGVIGGWKAIQYPKQIAEMAARGEPVPEP